MGTRLVEVRNTKMDKRDNLCHIETDGCIVNIRPSLWRDVQTTEDKISQTPRFDKVTAIEVIPDNYANEEFVWGFLDENDVFHIGSSKTIRVIRRKREP